MANNWNISDWLEKKVRERDKFCVYCHVEMKVYPHTKGTPSDKATWEHIDNNENNISEENIALCCSSCNSSKSAKKLMDWLEMPYCNDRKINDETVADIIKQYIKAGRESSAP